MSSKEKLRLISDYTSKVNNDLIIGVSADKCCLSSELKYKYDGFRILTSNLVILEDDENVYFVDGEGVHRLTIKIMSINDSKVRRAIKDLVVELIKYENMVVIDEGTLNFIHITKRYSSHQITCDIQIYNEAIILIFDRETKKLIHDGLVHVNITGISKNYVLLTPVLGNSFIVNRNGGHVATIKDKIINRLDYSADTWIINNAIVKIQDNKLIDIFSTELTGKKYIEFYSKELAIACNGRYMKHIESTQVYEDAILVNSKGQLILRDAKIIGASKINKIIAIHKDNNVEIINLSNNGEIADRVNISNVTRVDAIKCKNELIITHSDSTYSKITYNEYGNAKVQNTDSKDIVWNELVLAWHI